MAQPKVNNNTEKKPIEGKKFVSVLLGYKRMLGVIPASGDKPAKAFDFVLLYFAEFYSGYGDDNRGVYAEGFLRGNAKNATFETVKIRTPEFTDLVGVDYDDFDERFCSNYQFHPCRIMGWNNEYNEFEVTQVSISDQNIYDMIGGEPVLNVEGA